MTSSQKWEYSTALLGRLCLLLSSFCTVSLAFPIFGTTDPYARNSNSWGCWNIVPLSTGKRFFFSGRRLSEHHRDLSVLIWQFLISHFVLSFEHNASLCFILQHNWFYNCCEYDELTWSEINNTSIIWKTITQKRYFVFLIIKWQVGKII